MSLKSIDAICLRGIVGREAVSFEFQGALFTATCGARDTMRELVEGGIVTDQELSLLIPTENFGIGIPQPRERDVINVFVDNNGIPCRVDESDGAKVACRITQIGRALAGLTYTLATVQRG